VTEPQWLDVTTPTVQVRALTLGPADGPIALCLHGFPDTAYTWRKVAPQLVDAGWRVVAAFMRGYAPTSVPSGGSYHVGALMDDALRVLDAAGPTGRDVFIGHDWGALAGVGLGCRNVPRRGWCRSCGGTGHPDIARTKTCAMSTSRSANRSGGAPHSGTIARRFATARPPTRYAQLHRHWLSAPRLPTLYLHGTDDGCSEDHTPWIERVLPDESELALVENAGHFLQLDQPDVVARHIVDFVGQAS
jgi:pimeloyl-ACP methyl ester carboxylesterase